MIKVFLSTPCYGGLCLEKYMIGVIKLQLALIKEGIQLMIDTTENERIQQILHCSFLTSFWPFFNIVWARRCNLHRLPNDVLPPFK